MNKLIASTALAAALISPAFAGQYEEAEVETDAAIEITIAGFADEGEWINKPVFDQEGREVGEVERVSYGEDGLVDDIVVETGGVFDIGGEEILVAEGHYTVMIAEGDEDDAEIRLNMSAEEFLELPKFDEDLVSDYALSDNDLLDGVDESEGDIDTEVGASEDGVDLDLSTGTDLDL